MATLITEPIDLPLDVDGDVDMFAPLTTGLAAVVQDIRVRLGMFRGEWFLDLDAGVPYIQTSTVPASAALFGQRFNDVRARTAFRAAILGAANVIEVKQLDIEFVGATRVMNVTWRALTAFGDTEPDTLRMAV